MRCAGSCCCAAAVRLAPSASSSMKRSMSAIASSAVGPKWAASSSSALVCSTRAFAKPSAVQGPITNSKEGSYVSTDVIVDMSQALGGQYARGMFAKRDLAYGRELLNLPAYLMYIGDEPQREQVLILTKELFAKLVLNHPDKKFIESRILTMASGGFSYFTRERDVQEFAESVKVPNSFKTGADYLQSGEYGAFDLQKLPLILDFNRWEVNIEVGRAFASSQRRSILTINVTPTWKSQFRTASLRRTLCCLHELSSQSRPVRSCLSTTCQGIRFHLAVCRLRCASDGDLSAHASCANRERLGR
jgi:hypothetical protein